MKINGLFLKGGHSYKLLSRILSVSISLLLISSIFSQAVPVKANVSTAVIKVDNIIAQTGDTVDVGVSVQGFSGMNLAGYDFKITYDPSFLQVLDIKGPSDFDLPYFNITTPGVISAVSVQLSGEGMSGDLKLFNITVKVLGQVGQSPLTLNVTDFANADLNNIPFTVSNGSVSLQQTQPLAPNVSVDDVNNVIVGIDATMEYNIDGGNYIHYEAANVPDLTGTHTVLVRVTAAGTNPASEPTTLNFTINSIQPAAPIVSADDDNDVIIGIDTTMEYTIDGGNYIHYEAANAPDLTGAHTVLVRVAAAGANPASEPTTLNFTTNSIQPAAPNVSADDVNNLIDGIDNTMEYSLDNGLTYVLYDAQVPDLSGDQTVSVRVAASGINPAGLTKTLIFTTNPVENTPLKVTLTNATGAAGSEVQVVINLQDVQQAVYGTDGLVNSNFKILYDSNYLAVNSITPGSVFTETTDLSTSYTQTPGAIVFLSQDDSMGERLISTDGIFATIKFMIKAEAPLGDYLITFADEPKTFSTMQLSDYTVSWITPITVGGIITVKYVIGDVNGDNKFDVTDFGYLKLFLLGKITSFPSPSGMNAANVDGQGTVPDVTDFGYMKLRLLGKIAKFPIE